MPSVATSPAGIITGAETIDLREESSHGVLLLHGFGDTPQTLGLLAHDLHGAGFGVRAPLLPGHGRNVESFIASRRADWLQFADDELSRMRERHATVSVAGLSMGGALAAVLAAGHRDIASLALLAPYVEMPLDYRVAAASHWIWGGVAGACSSRSPRSILDPSEREKNLGYGVFSGRLLYELWRLSTLARESLARITVPTLLIQSRNDPRVAPGVATRAYAALGAVRKKLVWTEGGGHIITVDYGRERVFDEVREWFTINAPQLATSV